MNNLPDGLYFQDVYYYPYTLLKKRFFGYIPSSPSLDLDPSGRSIAHLLVSPHAAILSIQTIWAVEGATIPKLQEEIEKRYPGTGKIQLEMGSFSQLNVTLKVNSSNGTSHTFGPQQTSGFEPYRVVFSETLTTDEKNGAIVAFKGQENALIITYEATLDMTARSQVQIEGDIAEDVKALAPKKKGGGGWNLFGGQHHESEDKRVNLDECRDRVNRSIQAGRLTVTREETPNVSDNLRSQVEDRVKNLVANYMLSTIQQLGINAGTITSNPVSYSNQGSEKHKFYITRSLDIGKWFQSHDGSSLSQNSSVPISDPVR